MIHSQRHYQAVIQSIKEHLRSGSIQVGSPLPPDAKLAEELNFSVGSISDALRALALLGVLTQDEDGVYYLSGDMSQSFSDMFSLMLLMGCFDYVSVSRLRRGIELQALPTVMENLTEQEQRNLYTCLVRMMASEHGDQKADKEFHNQLITATRDQLVISLIRAMSQFMSPQQHDADGDYYFEYWDRLVQLHANLYHAIVDKDLPAATAALNEHYDIIDAEAASRARHN